MTDKTIKVKFDLDMPAPPEGMEYTGERRQVRFGEAFLNYDGAFPKWECKQGTCDSYFILKPKRWRAVRGDTYWAIVGRIDRSCTVCEHEEKSESLDDLLHESGNYYKTEEEGQRVLDEINALLLKRS